MRYLFMDSTPHLAGKAAQWPYNYRRMAVVELKDGFEGVPAMISERARGVSRIVEEAVLHVGKTPRSLGYREMERMRAKVDELNARAA